jgi:hypothetical protein
LHIVFQKTNTSRPDRAALLQCGSPHSKKACGIFSFMATNQQHPLRHITVKRTIIEQMLETMREFGSHGWEVLVLWLGKIEPEKGEAHVIHAFTPKQKALTSEDGVGYFVGGETLFQLNRDLSESGLRLIAQVHSHPQEAYHSDADDRYAIVTAEGGLSLVVPSFGRAPAHPTAWAVYRLHGQDWLEINTKEVRSLFEVIDD